MNFSKSSRCKSVLLRVGLMVACTFGSLQAAQEAFVWYDDADYKPYIYKDANGNSAGIFKDLMVEIFKRIHVPLESKVFAWKRTQVFVHNGLADGMVTVATRKRLETMVSSKPLVVSGEKIFVRKDHPKIEQIKRIQTIDALRDYRIVDVVGEGWAEEKFKHFPHVIWAPKLTSAFYLLANGRADIYVSNEFFGIAFIQSLLKQNTPFRENLKQIMVCSNNLEKIEYALLINKRSKWARLIPRINATIDQIKRDGTYDKIMRRYLQIDAQ